LGPVLVGVVLSQDLPGGYTDVGVGEGPPHQDQEIDIWH
jgi:hypothetical protein